MRDRLRDTDLQKLLLAWICTEVGNILVRAVSTLFTLMSLAVVVAVVSVQCLIDCSRKLGVLREKSWPVA
jgi:predicted metal-binding protein